MFKKILTAYKDLRSIRKQNIELRIEIEKLKKQSLFNALNQILGRDLSWFAFDELKPQSKKTYYDQAQHILRMDIFNNELNFLKSNWGKQAVLDAQDMPKEKVSEHIQKLSWMILGIELLKKRLEEVPDPNPQPKSTEDIYSSV